ncbi:MAG: NADH-quinone oxidoreductase subunit D [Armatimonadetes bacterium]|nr:NADH-quinone oxidoreductase subunit D [Armatimonadota bacterium]
MSELTRETLTINMGPQHPSTHGVLRLVLELSGETIVSCKPVIGYLHTGIEKEMETRTYHQNIALTDRIEYLASYFEEMAYCLAVEKLLGLEVPRRAQYIRVILCELNRIASHLVWLGTSALDLNASSVMMYAFAHREEYQEMSEIVSGQRMMPGYFRIGGVQWDLPEEFFPRVRKFIDELPRRLDEYEALLTDNPIWRDRHIGISSLSREQALAYGVTGPVLRASGVNWDLRKAIPYSSYEDFTFEVPVGANGDAFDRYTVRMAEMRESGRILRQALDGLPEGPYITSDRKVALPPRPELVRSMEAVIHQFKLVSEGIHPPKGEVYAAVESPRGEKGYFIVSDGSNKPVRVRVRAPSFSNLAALPVMVQGEMLADVVVAIASIDIVLGDVDR